MQPQYPPGNPGHPPQRPVRPVGILVSAIVLGLLAAFLLLSALGSIVTSIGGGLPGGPDVAGMPSAAFAKIVMTVLSLIYLALAGWSIGTLVGLVRMRSWARISAIVIAAGIAGMGLLSAVSMLAMQSIFRSGSAPLPPNISPDLLRKVLIFMAIASVVVAGLSIAWIIYLAQRRVREAFQQARGQQLAAQQPYPPPYGYVSPAPSEPPQSGHSQSFPNTSRQGTQAQQRAPNPLTDFTVARPIETPDAEVVPEPPPAPQAYAPPAWQPQPMAWPVVPVAAPPSRRPVSITIISIFALIGAFFSLMGVISPFPAFLFGALVGGLPLHLYSVVWAAGLAIAGLGMLRLQRPAWILAFALLAVNSLNFIIQLLPGPRARYLAFLSTQTSRFGAQQTALTNSMMAMSIVFSMVLALAFTALFAFLLWRARWAFPPAQPAQVEETPHS